MNLTLKTKTALLAVVAVVALLAAVGITQHQQLAVDFLSALEQQQRTLTSSMADGVADKLEVRVAMLERIADQLDETILLDPDARARFLNRHEPPRGFFDGVGMASSSGEMLANLPQLKPGQHFGIADREYFKIVMSTGQPYISEPLQARRNGMGAAVIVAVPVHNAIGQTVAMLTGVLHLQRTSVLEDLAETPVGQSGHFELVTVGANPLYIVHPDPAKVLAPAPPLASTDHEHITRIPVRGTRWELRAVLPRAEVEAPVIEAQRRLLMQLAGLGAVAGLLVWLGMNRLLQPLSGLIDAVRQLRTSPNAALPALDAHDERGLLAREFALLVEELRRQQIELHATVEASPLGFFRTDTNGDITFANEAYLRDHGLTRDQAARGWLSLLPQQDREAAWASWQTIVTQPEPHAMTRRVARADGSHVLLALRTAPLVVNGRLEGHVGTVSDVTERAAAEKAMRVLNAVFAATGDLVVQTDRNGNLTYMNPAARDAFGIAPDASMLGRQFSEFHSADGNLRLRKAVIAAIRQGGVWLGENTVLMRDGHEVPVSYMVIAHRNKAGRVRHFSAVLRDISEQIEAQQSLHRQTAALQSITEAIPSTVAVIDNDQRYRFVNQAFERWCGAPRTQVVGSTVKEVIGLAEYERSRPYIERALQGTGSQFERVRDASKIQTVHYVPLRMQDGTVDGFISVGHDITRHKREESRLLVLAHTDPLTGLLNRAGFENFFESCPERDLPNVALLYIDLDRFKPVNDAHGHTVGDQLLNLFSRRLRELVRPNDALARVGGDEFAIVLKNMRDMSGAQSVAEKVIRAASTPFEVDGLILHVGASIGVACGMEAGASWRNLVERADALLYRAKDGGRGRVATTADSS